MEAVKIKQNTVQTQKIKLIPSVKQSLQYLQMPIQELSSYIEEMSMRNPLLDVEMPPIGEPYPQAKIEKPDTDEISVREVFHRGGSRRNEATDTDFTDVYLSEKTFFEYLLDQLGQMKELDERQLKLCRILVGCLNSSGYMDCSLRELSEVTGVSEFELEQALYVIQMLDPPGVGASSLSECLLIQLAQSSKFSAVNVALVQRGLPLLASGDMAGLHRLLGVSNAELSEAVDTVRSLNPIPSQGFGNGSNTGYVIPEATVSCEDGKLTVELNRRAFPRVTLQNEYCDMLGRDEYSDAHDYLKKAMSEAKNVLYGLNEREKTLDRLIGVIIRRQQEYFLHSTDLVPMTMSEVAQELGCCVSTVSRAVSDKYILFGSKLLPLRSFFASGLSSTDGGAVTPSAIKRQLQNFISDEDKKHPLSDETLRCMFTKLGLNISRRTIAKYRGELNIPSTSQRRKR